MGKISEIDFLGPLKLSLDEILLVLVGMNIQGTGHQRTFLHPRMWYFSSLSHEKSASSNFYLHVPHPSFPTKILGAWIDVSVFLLTFGFYRFSLLLKYRMSGFFSNVSEYCRSTAFFSSFRKFQLI